MELSSKLFHSQPSLRNSMADSKDAAHNASTTNSGASSAASEAAHLPKPPPRPQNPALKMMGEWPLCPVLSLHAGPLTSTFRPPKHSLASTLPKLAHILQHRRILDRSMVLRSPRAKTAATQMVRRSAPSRTRTIASEPVGEEDDGLSCCAAGRGCDEHKRAFP
jgi:hypothetical protein